MSYIQAIVAGGGSPEKQLNADTPFYVATTGNDANNGSIGAPWLTLQHAYNVLSAYEFNGFTAIINIANGTYVGVDMLVPNTSGKIRFIGSSAAGVIVTPVSAAGAYIIEASSTVEIVNQTIQGTGTEVGIATSTLNTTVYIDGTVNFTSLNQAISAQSKALIIMSGTFNLTGNMENFTYLDGAVVCYVLTGSTFNIIGGPNWTNAFISINDQALWHIFGVGVVTFAGAATGQRFYVADGGVINTQTNNVSSLPGSVAGVVDVGGQYDNVTETPFYTTTIPAAAGDPGRPFQFTFDGVGNLYVCYATNTWGKYLNVFGPPAPAQQDAQPLGMP